MWGLGMLLAQQGLYPLTILPPMPMWHLHCEVLWAPNGLIKFPLLPNTLFFLLSNSTDKDYQEHTDQWLAALLNFNTVSIIDSIVL